MFLTLCQWLVIIALATTQNSPSQAAAWQANLQNGGEVQVDPQTRRLTREHHDGVPLWNGVHKLEDGSVITIRNGVAVPTETMYNAWSRSDPPKAAPIIDSCEVLVRRVCGLQGNCSTSKFCKLAKQLQNLEHDASNSTTIEIPHEGQDACRKALANTVTFPPCGQDAVMPDKACARLVTQTCGSQAQCKQTQACNAAHQLLVLEQQARLNNQETASATDTQCADALLNPFFTVCQKPVSDKSK